MAQALGQEAKVLARGRNENECSSVRLVMYGLLLCEGTQVKHGWEEGKQGVAKLWFRALP